MKQIRANLKLIFPILVLVSIFFVHIWYNTSVNQTLSRVILEDKAFKKGPFDEEEQDKSLIPGRFDQIDFSEGYQFFDWIDNEHILFSSRNSEQIFTNFLGKTVHYFEMNILSVIDRSTKKVKPAGNENQIILSISPDRKKVMYKEMADTTISNKTKAEDVKKENQYIQDLTQVTNNQKLSETGFLQWMPDSSGYIGLSDSLFFYNFKTEKKEELLDKKKTAKLGKIEKVEITRDGKTIFIKSSNKGSEDENYLYSLELENPKECKLLLQGCIENFEVLDKDNLVLNGVLQNKRGLYSYNISKEWSTTLLKGNIKYFSLSKDRKYIAYIKKEENEEEDMYAAKFNKDEVQSSIILYKNIFLKIYSIKWSDDNKKVLFSLLEEKSEKKHSQSLCIFTLK